MSGNNFDKNSINVFIPAAGLGERLQPITHHIPKPLIPIAGQPAIQYVLENVSILPFNKIGINLYHKKETVENWLSRCSFKERLVLFPETFIMGTGGALKNAGEFLKGSSFLVHNSDIISDIDLRKLLEAHIASGNIATLAVHDFPKFNTVVVDSDGYFIRVESSSHSPRPAPLGGEGEKHAFTGIAVYEPEILNYLSAGKSSVVDAWVKALEDGNKIRTCDVTGCFWSDIGTPSSYATTVFDLLRSRGETVYIHPSLERCRKIEYKGNVVLEEGCVVDAGVSLRNCVVLPGSKAGAIHEAPLHENCIIGPDFRIELNEPDILTFEDDKELIGTGGSDRKYYRTKRRDGSLVQMKCGRNDPDYERHIEYTRFFMKHSVPVPALISADSNKMEAVFEDAGDISLYSFLKCPRDKREIENIYRRVIDVMVRIHNDASEHVSECPLLQNRVFDCDYFRWETGYFLERFVQGLRHIEVRNSSAIKNEFHDLASKADSYSKTVIHRDFQSQNIMVMSDMEIRIIDYQGARIGPPAYDAASILFDPYYRLGNDMRDRLLDYYLQRLKGKNVNEFNESLFMESMITCRLQRHMQALGAYGYLSAVKGKRYFLKYVQEGLRLLKEDISLMKEEYPELYMLITGL